MNVDGTLVAQLPPLDPGKTRRRSKVSQITILLFIGKGVGGSLRIVIVTHSIGL